MKKTILVAVLSLFAGLTQVAQANTTWDWSFGTESGQFVMDGSGYSAGTYNLVDFSVTSSAVGGTIGSLSGGQYATGDNAFSTAQPFSFDWDGSNVTAWHHAGINGFSWWAFDDVPGAGKYFFGWGVGNFNIVNSGAYWLNNNGLQGAPALGIISVSAARSVPDSGSTLAMFGVAILAFGSIRRRLVA